MEATRYRWVVLAVGSAAQGATAAYFLGLAAVAPDLRAHFGLSLAGVGTLIGVISVGLVATLIAWGSAADRFGERPVMTVGLLGAGAALGAAALVTDPIAAGALLLLAGASGASVNAASGRAVLTWFPSRPSRPGHGRAADLGADRGRAGRRRAAADRPRLGGGLGGIPAVFTALAATCVVTALAVAPVGARTAGRHRVGPPTRPAPARCWPIAGCCG